MEQSPVLSADVMRQQEFDVLLKRATPERKAIFEKLQEKTWFANTDIELKKKLLTLPDKGRANHDGFLSDLANRPDDMANIRVERMVDLPHGSYALVPKFEVSRKDNPAMRYTYEYVSWRGGPLSGAKGVVFVEKDGRTTDFIVLKGEKFATGKQTYDTVGGFGEYGSDGVKTLDDRIVREIKEELGDESITVSHIQNLGRMNPDAGMANNEPELFAATISAEDAAKLSQHTVNMDVRELSSSAVVIPMRKLPDIVMTNNDGIFLSTIARAWAKGIIPPPDVLQGKRVGFSPN